MFKCSYIICFGQGLNTKYCGTVYGDEFSAKYIDSESCIVSILNEGSVVYSCECSVFDLCADDKSFGFYHLTIL